MVDKSAAVVVFSNDGVAVIVVYSSDGVVVAANGWKVTVDV